MTDPNATHTLLNNLSNLPIHPTGSGIADLETAYEQMRLAEHDDGLSSLVNPGSAIEIAVQNSDVALTETTAVEESVAHPS